METKYFMSYFSSAICYDMNIIRRGAVPFQPTRKAFSTNSECISVCWNSQKNGKQMLQKTLRVSGGENVIKASIQFSGCWWRHLKTQRAQGRKPSGGEGQTSSLLAQLLCQVPKSHQITAQKYQVTAFGRGAAGTRGASVGGSEGHLWHLRAGGTGKRNSGQRHSLKQENIMKRIAKQNERPP